MAEPGPETLSVDTDATSGFPNSPLPVLIYRRFIDATTGDPAASFETLFERHHWPPQWRYGLYDFDHFHSTAHEALGVYRGRAHIRLGGPNGSEHDIAAGDVLVLPAGVGHACLDASDGFCMVGAYPPGQQWEVERGDPAGLEHALARVAAVPMPEDDPVGGSLLSLWR
ncbi:cupin domain-containing protein [Salinicola peritrichatus]|uniref:cupin domain-containing protein n=1 Tax=Salinicola peritrichatus TaxID=1267424 RepID=UPI000DA23501|nr:cupin domain-containing protein [Salinicola peritrichatus]